MVRSGRNRGGRSLAFTPTLRIGAAARSAARIARQLGNVVAAAAVTNPERAASIAGSIIRSTGSYVPPTPGNGGLRMFERIAHTMPSSASGSVVQQAVVRGTQAKQWRGGARMSGKFKKPRRIKRRGGTRGFAFSGINYTQETGGSGDCNDLAVIGHSTIITSKMRVLAWELVLKKLLEKAGHTVYDVNTTLTSHISDTLALSVQRYPSDNPTTYSVTGLNAYTLKTLATYMADNTRLWNLDNSTAGQTLYNDIKYLPYTVNSTTQTFRVACLRLKDFRIRYRVKSSLKVQNQSTASETAIEADDVNNVPLYGKSYEGTGSGTVWNGKSVSSAYSQLFVGHNETGVITADGDAQMTEPPPHYEFDKAVTKTGKVRMNPGDIKYSNLYTVVNKSFDDFIQLTFPSGYGTTVHTRIKPGKFRFFIVEKILDATGTLHVKMQYEVNVQHSINGSEKYCYNCIQDTSALRSQDF